MFNQIRKKTNILFFLFATIITIPVIFGLLHQGFPLTDDGNWMVIRFSSFYESLRNGQFPVRFLFRLNNDFGYPVSNFLYPLFMYLGVPIHILGFNFVNSIKIIIGLSLIFSSVFSFLWLKKTFNNIASLIGAFLYTYFPYHLWDVYKRGSVGEVLALAIAPFILWQIEKKNYIFISFGIFLLITAHNSLAFMFLPFILLYMLIKKMDFKKIIISFLLGLGLSAFFWLPALYDKQFTVFDKTPVSDFSNYFVTLQNLSILGPIFFAIITLSTVTFIQKKNKQFGLFLILVLLLTLLVFPFSFYFWQYFPFVNYIQFPFRLISLIMLFSAFLISYQINLLKGKLRIIVIIIYIILIIFSAKDFIYPKSFQNYPDSFYSTNQDTTTVKNEYMPKWVKDLPAAKLENKIVVISGNATIHNLITNGNKATFLIDAKEKSTIQFNTVYFPGWKIKINNNPATISYEENGLIRFTVSSGEHNVKIFFEETNPRLFADLISIISLISLLFLALKERKVLFK